jgi:hypothetical protein
MEIAECEEQTKSDNQKLSIAASNWNVGAIKMRSPE